ncbi:MAG: 2-oxoacid:acceptor oxidoreductase family protein [Clostridia bacterium]|nr:2-oxoacid:acceptor oxidoreductase family protein [Clostridia bacterium]
MSLSIYLTGVGGQGVLTIAELIMNAAMRRGLYCNFYPTKGMAQRGGFVKAQLRIGDDAMAPEIHKGGADIVIAMELSESLRALDYLKPDGDIVIYPYRWLPTDVMLGKADYPDEASVMEVAKKRTEHVTMLDMTLLPEGCADNIFLLSAALKYTALSELFSSDELASEIKTRFPKGIESNMLSFEAGMRS